MMVRKGGGRSPGGMMSKKKSGVRRDGRKVVEKKAKRGGKTKFEEFLERDMKKSAHMHATADEDLALERRLAKKLKVKGGKLGGFDDGMADILDGLEEEVGVVSPPQRKGSNKSLPKKVESEDDEESESGSEMEEEDTSDGDVESGDAEESGSDIEGEELKEDVEEDEEEDDEEEENDEENDDEEVDDMSSASEEEVEEEMFTKGKKMLKDAGKPSKEEKNNKNKDENNAAVKYVPPHLREKASSESEEMARIQRRVRGIS
jgi:nucleolar MIF4G domain-containing protein 1